MSARSNISSNEPLTVRDRLQEAYRKIIFISENDFAEDPNYKRANQLLYAKIKKLEENQDFDMPRMVRDVIPNSNLAKYGQYEYNEARERSYSTNGTEIALHYPCLYKAEMLKEPWMLPEVELIFMHTVFSSSFNFILYESELEQLEKIDLVEETAPGKTPTCCTGDFHKVNPLLDQMFERTPGKAPGKTFDLDMDANMPYYFNVKEYDDILLRNRILSDSVRDLWRNPKPESKEKLLKVYKSSMDNLFISDEKDDDFEIKHEENIKPVTTEKSLQKLVSSILNLNEKVPKEDLPKDEESPVQETPQPARRLYSDVVQGNKTPSKVQNPPEVASASPLKVDNTKEVSMIHRGNMELHSVETSPILSPERSVETGFKMSCEEPPIICFADINVHDPSTSTRSNNAAASSPTVTAGTAAAAAAKMLSPSTKYTYSDAVTNAPANNGNVFVNEFSAYENSFRGTSNTNFQNFYTPVHYLPNAMYNTPYRLGYAAAHPFAAAYPNPTQQQPPQPQPPQPTQPQLQQAPQLQSQPQLQPQPQIQLLSQPQLQLQPQLQQPQSPSQQPQSPSQQPQSPSQQQPQSPSQQQPQSPSSQQSQSQSQPQPQSQQQSQQPQQISAGRQNMNASTLQHHWFFPAYRPPNLCTYGNFLGQLLVPQMPTKHRWTNPHYVRPPTPQNVYQPMTPAWGMQNVYRSNSTQQMPGYQMYDTQKMKNKKQSPNPCANGKFARSKTPDHTTNKGKTPKKNANSASTSHRPGKILTKPNSDFKLMTRNDADVHLGAAGPSRTFDMDTSIPVTCTASDELEKIALREYQSSNDMFFTEIERQAKEQYDGNPENLCCPPNKHSLGGQDFLML